MRDAFVEGVEKLVFGSRARGHRDIHVENAPDDRRGVQHLSRCWTQSIETTLHEPREHGGQRILAIDAQSPTPVFVADDVIIEE